MVESCLGTLTNMDTQPTSTW
ncbi:hypothetical protein LINPERPRIM_LOCUS16001 [Linum perenne]